MRTPGALLVVTLTLCIGAPRSAAAEEDTSKIDGRTAAAWARDLGSPDLDARRKAVFTLWNFGTRARPHVRALATALQDHDEYVRKTAEKVLARFHWQKSLNTLSTALPELIKGLGDTRLSVRMAAISTIWHAGVLPNVRGGEPPPKELLPALRRALADEDAKIRANAAACLANLTQAGAPALPALEKALADEDANVRMWSVRALAWIDAGKSIPAVRKLAGDEDDGVRIAVFEALAGAPAEHADTARTALEAGLGDKAPKVRLAAANGLWSLGRIESLPALARTLKHEQDATVRAAAANGLGGLGDPAAVPPLLEALQGTDEAVLAGAVGGLCRLGPEAAAGVPRMVELLESGSATLKRSVLLSMGTLGEWAEAALPTMVALLRHDDAGVRSMAASSLSGLAYAGLRSEALRRAAIAGLADEAREVRQYCVSIVSHFGPQAGAAVPGLLAVLERDGAQDGPTAVFTTLQRIGPAAQAALPALRKAANSSGYESTAAAAAVASISQEPAEIDAAVQVLIDGLTDEKWRSVAILRLAAVGPRARRAGFVLRVWMKSETPWRLAAAGALLRIEGPKASDAAAVLIEALKPKAAGAAMSAVRDLGPEGRALIPALHAHAKDPASNWRTGALAALIKMEARGDDVRAVFAAARKDKQPYVRTLGARGLAALAQADAAK